jgi:hypothetical protein
LNRFKNAPDRPTPLRLTDPRSPRLRNPGQIRQGDRIFVERAGL